MIGLIFLFAFLVLPIVEIAAFIEVGRQAGTIPTLLALVLSAFVGFSLIRAQGVATMLRARSALTRGALPFDAALDGFGLSLAGLLFIIPGFGTDALALALLVPPIRRRVMAAAMSRVNPMWRRKPAAPKPTVLREAPTVDAEYRTLPRGSDTPASSPWRRDSD